MWDIKDSPIDMLPIKEIATEILDLHSEPVHLNEVTEYVKQFWPKSTKFSIRSALKRYPYSFRIFEDDYVGSYSKKYSKTFVPISKNIEQNWGKQMQSVRIFIKRNNRLPYDTKKSKKESELYLWWKSQYDAMIHKDLSESKMKKIEAIALKYGKNSKS